MPADLLTFVAEALELEDIPVYRLQSEEHDSLLIPMRLPGAPYEEPAMLPILVTESTNGPALRFFAVIAAVRPKRRAAVQEHLSAANATFGPVKFYCQDDAVVAAVDVDLSILEEAGEPILAIFHLVGAAHRSLRSAVAAVRASLVATAKGRKSLRPRVVREAEDVARDAFKQGNV